MHSGIDRFAGLDWIKITLYSAQQWKISLDFIKQENTLRSKTTAFGRNKLLKRYERNAKIFKAKALEVENEYITEEC
ncbi:MULTISPECIES: hypothetical protein [unclassified Halomonas]|uniref:hypothetical protein n=1 Tax=unclassified Halomonas TaxID=2609666 RepID=UPI00207669A3|nr:MULTISPECIES: hypothetical protein [unclassified Halomonas]